jgi:hypothetical protein
MLALMLAVIALFALPVVGALAQTTENGITAPAEGATVTGTVDVTGYANDAAFSKWQLDVLPGGDANAAIFLAVGTTPGEFLPLDTTAYPMAHALRLASCAPTATIPSTSPISPSARPRLLRPPLLRLPL